MKYVSSVLLHNPRLMFTSVIRLKKGEKKKRINFQNLLKMATYCFIEIPMAITIHMNLS